MAYKYEKGWMFFMFNAADAERAWNCALDVEAWLKVMTAGDGKIKHVSGAKGKPGMTLIHSKMPQFHMSHRLGAWFEKYTIIRVEENQRLIFVAIETDRDVVMRKEGRKDLIVQVAKRPNKRGSYLVCIKFRMNAKPYLEERILQYHPAAEVLEMHFQYYSPKVV